MGDELRVTIVATGLGSPVERKQSKPVLVDYVEHKRTGTHDEPMSVTNYKELEMPAVIRTGRHREAAVKALESSGMDMLDIPSFLRKQAD
jgi:cell division protein FtsZ